MINLATAISVMNVYRGEKGAFRVPRSRMIPNSLAENKSEVLIHTACAKRAYVPGEPWE